MRNDKFTTMLEALYESYKKIARRNGMKPISKRAFFGRMRIWEW